MGRKNPIGGMDSPHTRKELTRFIKQQAFCLGFQRVGVTRAQEMKIEGHRLQTWLDLGYHASMSWMVDRVEERKEISRYLPEAKSVVCLGMNYFHGLSEGVLKVSNYAWGDDYHKVVKKRIGELLFRIRKIRPKLIGQVCVDTSPVMEKGWAQRAGIGWIGKHTNLITRDYGSWVFLGELILDQELDYDKPFEKDLCGNCTACLKACPAGAFVDEYVLDANRCISYLTIEHRSEMFDQNVENLYGWIYGCDICQEVCPWNIKYAHKSSETLFAPRKEILDRTVSQWLELTEEDYRRIFRNSAIRRVKFQNLKRNIKKTAQKVPQEWRDQ